jgi:hypothetical protein
LFTICRESQALPLLKNALARAYELFRKLLPYKFKYDLETPEKAFEFLEKKAADENRKAAEAEKRLHEILDDPTLIFYETPGTDLTAQKCYEELKEEQGYPEDFLYFLSWIVAKYLKEHGKVLKDRENQS